MLRRSIVDLNEMSSSGVPQNVPGRVHAKALGIPKFEAVSFVVDTYTKVQIGL